jgi:hypothetical protein
MITAIVRYQLPATIDRSACEAHFKTIAGNFGDVPGLIRKQFMWSETGVAGGVYQWGNVESAKSFYQGPWLSGILQRYGHYPQIDYFVTMAITDNPGGHITIPE